MSLLRRAAVLVIAAACASAFGAQASAKTIDLRYGIASYSFTYAPLYIAEDAGFFKKAGLNVSGEMMSGSGVEASATIAGNLPFFVGLPEIAALAIAKGQKLETFAELSDQFPTDIVISKSTAERLRLSRNMPIDKRLDALKGLRIADWVPGGAADMLMRFIMAKKGWSAQDVTLLPIGPATAMIAALQNNRIDGFAWSSPSSDEAVRRLGAFLLYRGARGPWAPLSDLASICLIGNADWLASHQQVAVAIYRALDASMTYMREHPQAAKAILRKRLHMFSDADFEAGYKNLRYMMPPSPAVGTEQAKKLQAFMKALDPAFDVPASKLTDPEIGDAASRAAAAH